MYNRKRIISGLLSLSLLASLTGCKGSQTENTTVANIPSQVNAENPMADVKTFSVEPKEIDDTFKSAVNNFSVELLKKTNLEEIKSGQNTLISPTSVLYAMCMTTNGADGKTKEELEASICQGIDIETFNKYMYSYSKFLKGGTSSDDSVKVKLANSIWAKKDITFEKDFLETDKSYYDAEIYSEPFDDNTKKNLNNWVKNATDGMIPQIIDRIDPDTVMFLVNAVCFDSKWAEEYEADQILEDCTFTNYKGDEETSTMLRSKEKYYIEDESSTGFIKNYKGDAYSFVAILPNEDVSVYDYVNNLSGEKLKKLIEEKTTAYEVYTRIPRFSYDYSNSLLAPLQEMGITNAFTDSADFTKMCKEYPLLISDIVHKTHIEVDENGTKAAAATIVTMTKATSVMADEPPYKEVYLDRPFVYAIIDNTTNLPLFIGVVNTVAE